MYGLGHTDNAHAESGEQSHLDLAAALATTCYEMYHRMPTGLSPEVAGMNTHPGAKEDIFINVSTVALVIIFKLFYCTIMFYMADLGQTHHMANPNRASHLLNYNPNSILFPSTKLYYEKTYINKY